jgi:hypothetical protein
VNATTLSPQSSPAGITFSQLLADMIEDEYDSFSDPYLGVESSASLAPVTARSASVLETAAPAPSPHASSSSSQYAFEEDDNPSFMAELDDLEPRLMMGIGLTGNTTSCKYSIVGEACLHLFNNTAHVATPPNRSSTAGRTITAGSSQIDPGR